MVKKKLIINNNCKINFFYKDYEYLTVNVSKKEKLYALYHNNYPDLIDTFKTLLRLSIKKKLIIEPEFQKQSIGLSWVIYMADGNEFFEESYTNFKTQIIEKYKACLKVVKKHDWIGERYLLCSSICSVHSAWVYNDEKGQIILEITPKFDWNQFGDHEDMKIYEKMLDEQRSEIKQKFEAFLDNYKESEKIIIPEATAIKFLAQLKQLVKEIER